MQRCPAVDHIKTNLIIEILQVRAKFETPMVSCKWFIMNHKFQQLQEGLSYNLLQTMQLQDLPVTSTHWGLDKKYSHLNLRSIKKSFPPNAFQNVVLK